MPPICNACQSSKLCWRMAVDSIQSRNHHFSSGQGREHQRERRHPDEKSTSALVRLLDYSWSETTLVPTSELHEASRTMQPLEIIVFTRPIDGTVECASFELIMAVL